jgi:hypothetical protein
MFSARQSVSVPMEAAYIVRKSRFDKESLHYLDQSKEAKTQW